jgi:charged multivesicular body protein 3
MSWLFGWGSSNAAAAVTEVSQAEKDATMKEKEREWQHKLKHQQREIDKSIRDIERDEAKVKIAIKKAVKEKQMQGAKALAKQIVMSGKSKERLLTCKVHLEGIGVHLKTAAATLKVTGAMGRSADMMKSMNALIKASETSQVSRELAKEMARFGIIEEMMDEQLDAAMDPDGDLEELADSQVEALVQEICAGVKMTGAAGSKSVPKASAAEEADMQRQAAELERRMKELGE